MEGSRELASRNTMEDGRESAPGATESGQDPVPSVPTKGVQDSAPGVSTNGGQDSATGVSTGGGQDPAPSVSTGCMDRFVNCIRCCLCCST